MSFLSGYHASLDEGYDQVPLMAEEDDLVIAKDKGDNTNRTLSALNAEQSYESQDQVLSMRAVDARNTHLTSPVYDLFLTLCDACGVSDQSASVMSLIHSLTGSFGDYAPIGSPNTTLVSTLRLCYRILQWASLCFVTFMDTFSLLRSSSGVYIRSCISFLMFICCAASLLLATDIIQSGTILTRASQNMLLSPNEVIYKKVFHSHIFISMGIALAIATVGFTADYIDSKTFYSVSNPFISGLTIALYRLASALMQLQIAVGVAVLTLLLFVLKDRVRLSHRMLALNEGTSVETALRRFIDLDITVSHAAHKYTAYTLTILLGFLLKFLQSAFYHVSEDQKTGLVGSAGPDTVQLLDMVVQPFSVCAVILIMVGSLNQQVEYLFKVCARYILRQRSRVLHDKKLVKDLQNYSKNGDFYFRMHGFVITLSTVWKLLAVCVSTYILLLRFKRWGII